jgi:hypothetical protein
VRRAITLALASTLALAAAACGEDEGPGLADHDEAAAPVSEKELRMTEQQREQQNYKEEERVEEKEFDAAEGSGTR